MSVASGEIEAIAGILALGIILIPILGSFVVFAIGRYSQNYRDMAAICISAITFLLSLSLLWHNLYETLPVSLVRLPAGFLEPLFLFRTDLLGSILIVMAAFIWFLATLFSRIYMDHEHEKNRYYLFYLLSLGSCLGVFLAGDFLTLFVFFEIMTFSSYVLVIHAQSKEAMEAGNNYLFLGVGGGLALLGGIFLLFFYTGTLSLQPQAEVLQELGNIRYLIAFLMISGFGIKAGMAPLHIWLPQAHPVAPAPASALLSGLMIKTGAYGIIRVLNMLFSPADPTVQESWAASLELGYIIIWAGIITMFMAAFIALFQTNAKRILAYSSVSQMGYILMGLGVAAFIGYEEGAMGLSGSFYHIVNHAFFKASMFMIVGAVYIRTHELSLNRLGGLYRKFPVMMVAFFIAAAGITGVPGLNGYTSKTVLHHAIEDAFKYSGEFPLFIAERIFTVTSIFTVCYISKLFYGIFFGPGQSYSTNLKGETGTERVVFAVFSIVIIALGIFPNFFMNNFFLPASAGFSFYPGKIEYLTGLNFWAWPDLQAILQVLILGLLLFILARKKLNNINLPAFLSVEVLVFRPLIRVIGVIYTQALRIAEYRTDKTYINSPFYLRVFTRLSNVIETGVEKTFIKSPYSIRLLTMSSYVLDTASEGLIVHSLKPMKRVSEKVARFELTGPIWIGLIISRTAIFIRDLIYNSCNRIIKVIVYNLWLSLHKVFKFLIHMDYRPKGIKFFEVINMSSLDLSLFIMVIFLLFLMSLWFIFP